MVKDDMIHPKLTEALQKMSIFRGLSKEDVEKFLDRCKGREVPAGEVLFSDGDQSDSIYFLILGHLEVYSNGIQVASIENWGVAGEMGAITGLPRTASVIAKSVSRVLCLKRTDIAAVVDSDPVMGLKLYRNVVKILSRYVRKSNLAHESFLGDDETSES